ncbi:MAG: DUF6675 family protein [Spirochaetia bacterium]
MKLLLVAIQTLFVLLPLAAEDPLAPYLPEKSLNELRAGKLLTASIPSDYKLSLMPAIISADSIASEVKDRQPSMGVELTAIITGLPQAMDTQAGWLLLYNALHAVSTMKGIPYYSASRGISRVLFTDSYVIDSADKKNRVADPVFDEIPPEDLIFTFQEDSSFGKNVYEEHFSEREDHFVVKMENLTTISFLFLPLIQPRDLVSQVVLIPSGNEVVFYGVSYLRTAFPLGDRHSREQSLKNRLVAMENWLKARLGGEAQ